MQTFTLDNTMTSTLEAKRAELAALAEQAQRIIDAEVESILIDAEIAQLQDPDYIRDKAATKAVTSELARLDSMISTCTQLYTSIPTRNKEGVLRKTPNINRIFGQGETLDKLVGLIGLVRFAPKEHQLVIEAKVGKLTPYLMEQFIRAVGSKVYINRAGVVIPEVKGNYKDMVSTGQQLLNELGVRAPIGGDKAAFKQSFKKARLEVETEVLAKEKADNEEEMFIMGGDDE